VASIKHTARKSAARSVVSRDADFHRWLLDRASALRSRDFGFTDWNDVAEELEAMAKSDERSVTSHLKNLFEHLLKWQFVSSHRGSSWEKTIKVSRDSIRDILNDSPSLNRKLPAFVLTAYARARRDAADEMKARHQDSSVLPDSCPWTFEVFMSEDFWPSE
jgi:hypothetical protein